MLRQSFVSLIRRPQLSAGIIITLGLAFAATLIVLGLLDNFLLRPLPYGDANRLTVINEYSFATGSTARWRMTFGNAADIHDQASAFSRTAIVRNEAFTVHAPGGTEVAFVQRVTPEFFSMLGLRAHLGDIINPANAELEGERALVLSNDFWQRRFGGSRTVIGQSVQLDQRNYRIVGVMPANMTLPVVGEGQQGWVAMLPVDFQRDERATRRHFMFGELAPGHTIGSAQGELAALAATLRRDYPASNADRGFTTISLRDALVGTFRQQLIILQATVALVLTVASINAACLLLAQAIRRRREFAVRLALGASTRNLFRQFFIESLWLTCGGALLGLLLAAWLAPLTIELLPAASLLHPLPPPAVTSTVVAAAFVLALAIAVVFSLVPLLQTRRLNLEAVLRDGSRQVGSVAGGVATRLLVSIQVAVALALLIAAIQLVRSFQAVKQVDYGIPIEQLYTFRLGTRGGTEADPAARMRYFEAVVEKLKTLPHVAAGATTDYATPTVPGNYLGFVQEGDGLNFDKTPKRANRRFVSVDLLDTLQLPLQAGRWLTADDRRDTRRVAVVSQSLADKYWPGQDAVGRRAQIEGTTGWWEIVGVVGDILSHGSQPKPIDSFFLSHSQETPTDTSVFMRVRGTQPLTKQQIDEAVAAIDLNNTAYAYTPVRNFYAESSWQTRFSLTLVGIFASLAVMLCLMGVYAVLAFAVSGRSSEFGVRLALGASRNDIAALVLRDAARMTVPGLFAGILLASVAARGIAHLLYGVSPFDPLAYLGAFMALATACIIACLVPARRAMKVDPLVALRAE